MRGDSGKVRRGRVPDVALPAIARIPRRQRVHDTVTGYLRDDRCTRDAVTARVASDDGGVRRAERSNRAAVEDDVIGTDGQAAERAAHREHSGVSETFTVRKISNGVGVERIFPVHSPMLAEIQVVRRGRVRRAKLYYLRHLTGKATRIKEKKVRVAVPETGTPTTE